jgi:hypothetical protein
MTTVEEQLKLNRTATLEGRLDDIIPIPYEDYLRACGVYEKDIPEMLKLASLALDKDKK